MECNQKPNKKFSRNYKHKRVNRLVLKQQKLKYNSTKKLWSTIQTQRTALRATTTLHWSAFGKLFFFV